MRTLVGCAVLGLLPVPPGLEGVDHGGAMRGIASSPANDPFVQLFEMRPDLKQWGGSAHNWFGWSVKS
jgi:hypothetical protein